MSTKDSAGLPVTYYGIVHPEGGTFSWGYNVLGANNAIKIVGPTNQPTVQIQALQNQSSATQGDQIIECDYTYTDPQGNSTTVSDSFKITVARPVKLVTVDPGVTKQKENYVYRYITYQIIDQFNNPLKNVYSFSNGTTTVSERVANLLVGEDLLYVVGPPHTFSPTNNGVVQDNGQFIDEIQLSWPQDWQIDQWWYCHMAQWTSDSQDTGNLVRSNIITVSSGDPDIVVTEVK